MTKNGNSEYGFCVAPPQGSMKHIIGVIVLLLCCLHVSGQDITLVGQVRDAFLKKALVARISVYETDSTTCILDSVPVERIDDANDRIMAALYNAPVRPVKHDYLIKAELPGYDVAWQKVSVTNTEEKEVRVPLIEMRRARHVSLGEVVVTATKVKMYYRGDTLIYDATAFSLPDGSMLDDLIRQMPGVTMDEDGEIFVNGRKVDELLLGSRSFFGGNKQILLENLPYYTVKNIKVYDRESKMNTALGSNAVPKQYVMDVNLKEEYNRSYIANVEGAAGTHHRWLGRLFGLSFTDRWRFTLLGNVNNVNETQHIGKTGSWSPLQTPRSMITTRSVRSEIAYQSRDEMIEESFRSEFVSSDEDSHTRQSREQFLDGSHPLSLTESTGRLSNWKLALRNNFNIYAPFYMVVTTDFNYGKRDGTSGSAFRQWGDSLTASMHTAGMSKGTSWNAFTEVLGCINVGKVITYIANFERSSDRSESASRFITRNYTVPSLERRYNTTDYGKQVTKGELD